MIISSLSSLIYIRLRCGSCDHYKLWLPSVPPFSGWWPDRISSRCLGYRTVSRPRSVQGPSRKQERSACPPCVQTCDTGMTDISPPLCRKICQEKDLKKNYHCNFKYLSNSMTFLFYDFVKCTRYIGSMWFVGTKASLHIKGLRNWTQGPINGE